MEAINHALTILSWFENNAEKEMPHENIWDDSEALEQHWKAVQLRRADGVSESDDDDNDGPDGGDMLGNDLANMFKD